MPANTVKSSKDRPNVLILFTDQQRHDTIAAAGHAHMISPNLDRLVREGALYTQAHSPNPVCIPARHNLLTGLTCRYHGYPSNWSRPMDARLPTLPRILSDGGYETRSVGKMHFIPPRRHHGFDRMELMREVPQWREQDDYAMYLKSVGYGHIQNVHGIRNLLYMVPQRSLIPEEHHGTTWVGDRTVDFIRTNAGRHPWFLWAGWIAPHPPFDVPDTFADLYKDRDLPAPLVSETALTPSLPTHESSADVPASKYAEVLRRMREVYYAQVSLVDKQVGKILDALEESGQLDNTLIIHTSDHGEMLGDHGCFQKQIPYESAAHIPMILRFPSRIKAGTTSDAFVDLNDLLPTILDATGIPYPGPYELPGGSLFRDDKDRTYQYMESGHRDRRWASIRDRQYKFNYFYTGSYEELFDLENDPGETVNLLAARPDAPEVREVRDHLREVLWSYEHRWGMENYTTIEGGFLPIAEPEKPTGPFRRNNQFARWHEKLTDPEERSRMNTLEQEVIQAVADEPLINLCGLDLDAWQRNGVPAEVIERIRAKGL